MPCGLERSIIAQTVDRYQPFAHSWSGQPGIARRSASPYDEGNAFVMKRGESGASAA